MACHSSKVMVAGAFQLISSTSPMSVAYSSGLIRLFIGFPFQGVADNLHHGDVDAFAVGADAPPHATVTEQLAANKDTNVGLFTIHPDLQFNMAALGKVAVNLLIETGRRSLGSGRVNGVAHRFPLGTGQ